MFLKNHPIRPLDLVISLALFLLVLTVFSQAIAFQFLTWDDPQYVTNNLPVRQGLSLGGFVWAFTAFHAANWHPLTWLSHMLDVSLFELDPRGHHATNIVFHLSNVILLYAFFVRTTAARWRSALVAALFAIHPLHVESVVWISERKDVLSTFFWLLTMHFYVGYVKKPGLGRYFAVATSLSLGLLSKPMLVTLPLVLLLLDIWPLKRLILPPEFSILPGERARRLIIEKMPLFGLAILSMVLTFIAQSQGSAVVMVDVIPISDRAANALISYAEYLRMTFYPTGQSFFYPFREHWKVGSLLLSIAVLTSIAVWAWRARASKPPLLVGWLWYLGTLVPVIGLVQVGAQAMADRYTYIPLIGVFVMLAWSIQNLDNTLIQRVTAASTAIVIAALTALAYNYAEKWRTSADLYRHALSVTPDNYRAHSLLSVEYSKEGKLNQALHHVLESQRLGENLRLFGMDNIASNHVTLGNIALAQNNLEKAFEHFVRAAALMPDSAIPRLNQGIVLAKQGKHDFAIVAFEGALRLTPDHAAIHNHLGVSKLMTGQTEHAVQHFRQALTLQPDYFEARLNLSVALAKQGHRKEAAFNVTEVLRVTPNNPIALKIQQHLAEK